MNLQDRKYEASNYETRIYEVQIDQTLRLLGSANPRPGLEKRIAAHLAHAPESQRSRSLGLPRLISGAAAALAALAIVAGSVNHSHRILPIAPGAQLPVSASSGIGAASAQKAAPQPVSPPPNGRPRSMRKARNGTGNGRPAVRKQTLPQ